MKESTATRNEAGCKPFRWGYSRKRDIPDKERGKNRLDIALDRMTYSIDKEIGHKATDEDEVRKLFAIIMCELITLTNALYSYFMSDGFSETRETITSLYSVSIMRYIDTINSHIIEKYVDVRIECDECGTDMSLVFTGHLDIAVYLFMYSKFTNTENKHIYWQNSISEWEAIIDEYVPYAFNVECENCNYRNPIGECIFTGMFLEDFDQSDYTFIYFGDYPAKE